LPDTLVDSSILLDLLTEDPRWLEWSSDAVETAGNEGRLLLNPIVYAEVSVDFERIEDLDLAFPTQFFERVPLPWAAAFLAGKCFQQYRRRGGEKTSPLPDFYIGAHAAVAGVRLLTRDPRRYRTYFPKLPLISP
jgi:predicted nucleic acid-binding protein